MIRILLADDHELVRHGTRRVLAEAIPGVDFGEARNAAEAIAALVADTFSLLVLDLNMPGRGGLEVLEESRRRWPDIPVLVLTAYPEEELAVRCMRLGAAGYVTKGSAAAELVAAVRKVFSGGKYVTAAVGERLAAFVGGSSELLPHEILARRELQVLKLVASGRTLKEIGVELGLSEKTVATYRARLADKLGFSRNVELVRYAMKHGLVD